jgi:DNA-binding CsgD family transcriptional regulator
VGRLSQADLRHITRFLTALQPGTARDPFTRSTLAALTELIGADSAEYFELRRLDRGVIASVESQDFEEAPGSDEALRAFGHQNPLRWRRWHPGHGPMRLSALTTRRALERLAFHDTYLRPNRLTDLLKVWLHSDDASVACVQLWRSGSTFDQRAEDLLAVLQHHLARARSDAIARAGEPQASESLTRREVEVLTWAMRAEPDEAIGARLGMSTATVGKHLEHAFEKLGVHSRTEALWRVSAPDRASATSRPAPDRPAVEEGGRLGP